MTDLTITALAKSYPDQNVLDGVDLEVPASTLTAVLGPSGCGKTTLLRLVAGFDRPDSGTITIGPSTVTGDGSWIPAHRRQIGYVAQEGSLFPHLTVAANISFGLPRRERRNQIRLAELLDLVGLDPALRTRYPHQLSGGQQQRVALARALAPKPRVVLLDEPFSALDTALREGTRRAVVAALTATGTTTILVTHDQAEALSLANQVAVMRHGQLIQTGTPTDLYRRPADLELAGFLGSTVILPATITDTIAQTVLGAVPVRRPCPGGSDSVMIRPEQLALAPPEPGAPAAHVTAVTFYGPDAVVDLKLPGTTTITARVPSHQAPEVGTETGVTVHGTATAYPSRVEHLRPAGAHST
ncbi:ABC transporter ATP-binding protein [Plantactinospora mayteni]|uniref:ABC transporter n=1 Tax=Plantactinospora mayteni TaxID=566021 RepID=A0ABQ4F212_9ACTN|nr:ABC transporter ATP-binding protein [Plantactinospora mayteni]GIH00958.1 ABC transporter [Plantactinospora mayteni]